MALVPVDTALHRILAGVKPVPTETVALDAAVGRVLAKSVVAKRDQPPFAASAMDGYAVRHVDVAQAPVSLRVVGVSAAGHGFKGNLKAGQAVRISTGAPMPEGSDTVIIQENTARTGDLVTVTQGAALGKNIRRRGLDFARGDVLLAAPALLRPRDIGLAAAANAPKLSVRRPVRIALLTTGDELVLPGQKARADQIYSSNSHAISAMAKIWGAEVRNLGIVADSLKATIAAVRKGLAADILLTTGGASVGDHDHVQAAFKACGISIDFWKIAMRPGKPFMHGRKGKLHVMGLPGNPVAALLTARLFVRPLMLALQGQAPELEPQFAAVTVDLPANDERQDYVRATLATGTDGRRSVTPFGLQDSSMQRTLQLSQAVIIRAPHAPAVSAGSQVPVFVLDF